MDVKVQVIPTDFQTLDLIIILGARAQKKNWCPGATGLLSDPLRSFIAIHPRHFHVHENEIRRFRHERLDGFRPTLRSDIRMAHLHNKAADDVASLPAIINDENFVLFRHAVFPVGRSAQRHGDKGETSPSRLH